MSDPMDSEARAVTICYVAFMALIAVVAICVTYAATHKAPVSITIEANK